MDSWFISICKFGCFKKTFAKITSLSELYFGIRRFILLVPTKKVISMNYGSTSCGKPWRWVRLDLIFSIRDIYINSNLNPLTKFMSSSRSMELKGILPCSISQMITKTISIITRIVISYAMKQGIPLSIWWKAGLGMTCCHPCKLRKRRLRWQWKAHPKVKLHGL